jgi:5-methylcytosine-specific restriction endonuclease McrA
VVLTERTEAASTWTHEQHETRRDRHVDKRHGVRSDQRRDQRDAQRGVAHRDGVSSVEKHREIDGELRRIAKQRAAFDVEEARWLREAERHQVWRKLGFSTALEYLEDVFGYAPRTAMERLRVAKQLAELPGLEAELASGTLPYSAAKELSRVMTATTEAQWLARARGKNLRDIEEMVAGRKRGDNPDDPPDPELVLHEVRLTLTARTKALWEQMRAALEQECDGHLEDDQLAELVTRRVLGGDSSPSDRPPRPPHRIVVHKCEDCRRAWQDGKGRRIQLRDADLALAECDAIVVREDDGAASVREDNQTATVREHDHCVSVREHDRAAMVREDNQTATVREHDRAATVREDNQAASTGPAASAAPAAPTEAESANPPTRTVTRGDRSPKTTSTIPARTRKRVWARDQGRCRVPGCRATRHIDIHHLIPRALGGTHDEWNMVLLCAGHHTLHHAGILSIMGRAPDELVFIRDGKRLVDARSSTEVAAVDSLRSLPTAAVAPNRFADVVRLEHAKQALRELGFSARAARTALEQASAHVDPNADVGQLVRAALALSRAASPEVTASATRNSVGEAEMTKLATQALVQLGFPRPLATTAVNAASAHVGDRDLQTLIREALRRTSA